MKADEIRRKLSSSNDEWNDWPLYSGSNGAIPALLVEIAAQLAELNDNLRRRESLESPKE